MRYPVQYRVFSRKVLAVISIWQYLAVISAVSSAVSSAGCCGIRLYLMEGCAGQWVDTAKQAPALEEGMLLTSEQMAKMEAELVDKARVRAQQRDLYARKEEEDAKQAASQRLCAPPPLQGGAGRQTGEGTAGAREGHASGALPPAAPAPAAAGLAQDAAGASHRHAAQETSSSAPAAVAPAPATGASRGGEMANDKGHAHTPMSHGADGQAPAVPAPAARSDKSAEGREAAKTQNAAAAGSGHQNKPVGATNSSSGSSNNKNSSSSSGNKSLSKGFLWAGKAKKKNAADDVATTSETNPIPSSPAAAAAAALAPAPANSLSATSAAGATSVTKSNGTGVVDGGSGHRVASDSAETGSSNPSLCVEIRVLPASEEALKFAMNYIKVSICAHAARAAACVRRRLEVLPEIATEC